jgi:hypothetical protein
MSSAARMEFARVSACGPFTRATFHRRLWTAPGAHVLSHAQGIFQRRRAWPPTQNLPSKDLHPPPCRNVPFGSSHCHAWPSYQPRTAVSARLGRICDAPIGVKVRAPASSLPKPSTAKQAQESRADCADGSPDRSRTRHELGRTISADEDLRLLSGAFDEEIWGRGPTEIDGTGDSHGLQVLLARFPIMRGTHDHSAPGTTRT